MVEVSSDCESGVDPDRWKAGCEICDELNWRELRNVAYMSDRHGTGFKKSCRRYIEWKIKVSPVRRRNLRPLGLGMNHVDGILDILQI